LRSFLLRGRNESKPTGNPCCSLNAKPAPLYDLPLLLLLLLLLPDAVVPRFVAAGLCTG
jgi:hypothetical protein